jgi:hypothetical protein
MTPEEKAALEAKQKAEAEADADAEEDESTEDESEEEESEDEDESDQHIDSDDTDYQAELEKERTARKRAEDALAEKRFKSAEKRRKSGEEEDESSDDDEDDDDKPLTGRRLETILARERQQTEKIVQAKRIQEIAKSLAQSDAEANLIVEIHRNRTFPAHLTLEEQLDEAYVIANRKKIVGQRDELLRALKGKDGANRNGAQSHKIVKPAAEPKTSSQDVTAIKLAGFKWNGIAKRYEKKLPNGDIIYRDPKTKQTGRIPKR